MTFDPTTNRIQTMLLTPEERAALEAWPHGWELFYVHKWVSANGPHLNREAVYRGKPAPVVTSVWFNLYEGCVGGVAYERKLDAEQGAHRSNRIDILRIDTCNGVSTAHLEGLE